MLPAHPHAPMAQQSPSHVTLEPPRSQPPPGLVNFPQITTEHYSDVHLDPQYYERVVEVPRYEFENRERIIEVPQPQLVDRVVEVPQVQEVVHEVPGPVDVKVVTRAVPKIEVRQQERIVEVPQIEYVDRYVEVPEVREIVRRIPRVEVHEIPIERIIQVPKKIHQEIEQPIYRPVPHLVQQPVEREIPVARTQMQTMEMVEQVPLQAGGEARPPPPPPPAPVMQTAVQYTPQVAASSQVFTSPPASVQKVVYTQEPVVSSVQVRPAASMQQVVAPVQTVMSQPVQQVLAIPQTTLQTAVPVVQTVQSAAVIPTSSVQVLPAVQTVQATGSMDLFDTLDRNHDGVLTRDEMQQLAAPQVVGSVTVLPTSPPTPPRSSVMLPSTAVASSSTVLVQQPPGYMTPPTPPAATPASAASMVMGSQVLRPGTNVSVAAPMVAAPMVAASSTLLPASPPASLPVVTGSTVLQSSQPRMLSATLPSPPITSASPVTTSARIPASAASSVNVFQSAVLSARQQGYPTYAGGVASSMGSMTLPQPYQTYSGGVSMSNVTMPQGITPPTPPAVDVFSALDRNHDGVISRGEFDQVVRSGVLNPVVG